MLGRAQAAAHEEPPIIRNGPVHAAAADARCAAAGSGARSVADLTDLMVYSVDGSTCAPCGRSLPYATSRSPCPWFAHLGGAPGPRSRSVPGTAASRDLGAAVRLGHAPGCDLAHDSAGRVCGRGSSRSPAHGAPGRAPAPVWSAEPPCHWVSAAVLTGTRPGLQQLQPSRRPRRSRPCPLPTGEHLGGVARRFLIRTRRSQQTSSGSVPVTARVSRRWASARTRRRRRSG